jgi:hypothetical protein
LNKSAKKLNFNYKEEQAYIQAHKADFERLLEEDRQAMAKEMSGTLWGALDSLTRGDKKWDEGKDNRNVASTMLRRCLSIIDSNEPIAPLLSEAPRNRNFNSSL